MSQKRFIQHLDPLTSFEANEEFLGLFEPGRMRGFDTFNQTAPLDAELLHTATGVIKTEIDNSTQSAPTGIIVTKQGVFIHEDAAVPIVNFTSNAASTKDRIDLIICEHEWLVSAGGQVAIYSVVVGLVDDDTPPALPNPEKQIIVGFVRIPAGDANLNNAIYGYVRAPGQGGENPVLQYQGVATSVEASGIMNLNGDGIIFNATMNNTALRFISDKPIGTLIFVNLINGSETVIDLDTSSSSPPANFKAIFGGTLVVDALTNTNYGQNNVLIFLRTSNGVFDGWTFLGTSQWLQDVEDLLADVSDLQTATGETGPTPNYSSNNIVTDTDDHNEAISDLDAAFATRFILAQSTTILNANYSNSETDIVSLTPSASLGSSAMKIDFTIQISAPSTGGSTDMLTFFRIYRDAVLVTNYNHEVIDNGNTHVISGSFVAPYIAGEVIKVTAENNVAGTIVVGKATLNCLMMDAN